MLHVVVINCFMGQVKSFQNIFAHKLIITKKKISIEGNGEGGVGGRGHGHC